MVRLKAVEVEAATSGGRRSWRSVEQFKVVFATAAAGSTGSSITRAWLPCCSSAVERAQARGADWLDHCPSLFSADGSNYCGSGARLAGPVCCQGDL